MSMFWETQTGSSFCDMNERRRCEAEMKSCLAAAAARGIATVEDTLLPQHAAMTAEMQIRIWRWAAAVPLRTAQCRRVLAIAGLDAPQELGSVAAELVIKLFKPTTRRSGNRPRSLETVLALAAQGDLNGAAAYLMRGMPNLCRDYVREFTMSIRCPQEDGSRYMGVLSVEEMCDGMDMDEYDLFSGGALGQALTAPMETPGEMLETRAELQPLLRMICSGSFLRAIALLGKAARVPVAELAEGLLCNAPALTARLIARVNALLGYDASSELQPVMASARLYRPSALHLAHPDKLKDALYRFTTSGGLERAARDMDAAAASLVRAA